MFQIPEPEPHKKQQQTVGDSVRNRVSQSEMPDAPENKRELFLNKIQTHIRTR